MIEIAYPRTVRTIKITTANQMIETATGTMTAIAGKQEFRKAESAAAEGSQMRLPFLSRAILAGLLEGPQARQNGSPGRQAWDRLDRIMSPGGAAQSHRISMKCP
jgi:hypothetical protein